MITLLGIERWFQRTAAPLAQRGPTAERLFPRHTNLYT